MATVGKVRTQQGNIYTHNALTRFDAGGKAKPLKAPKKEKKDLDEDEVAYREKQKAGMSHLEEILLDVHALIDCTFRCQSPEGDGRKGERKGTA